MGFIRRSSLRDWWMWQCQQSNTVRPKVFRGSHPFVVLVYINEHHQRKTWYFPDMFAFL